MVPHSGPFVRGIFVTCYLFADNPIDPERLERIYEARCAEEPFLRLREGTPRVTVVRGTNFCDLTVTADGSGRRAVVMSTIDNLVKGMAGQAIQNMNLMFGISETEGL